MKKLLTLVIGLFLLTACTLGTPDDTSAVPPATNEKPTVHIDLSNCETFFDGCNHCMVTEGRIMGCTRMACPEMKEPKCVKFQEAPTVDLSNCERYFDGCNTCGVENGEVTECTEMACAKEDMKAPKCLEYKNEVVDKVRQPTGEEENETVPTSACEQNGGTFDAEHNECFGIDKNTCESIGGNFDECASPCRHDPEAEMCIMMCEVVCEL